MLANAGSLIPTNDILSSWVMGASKFFNGITRLLTTERGSSGTASKREATLNKRGRLSSNYCGICTPNMEDNTHTPPPYRGTELALLGLILKPTMRLLQQPREGRSGVSHKERVPYTPPRGPLHVSLISVTQAHNERGVGESV